MKKAKILNDQGTILPTVLILFSVLIFLLTASAGLLRSAHHERSLLSDSYRIKIMLNMTEDHLKKDQQKQKNSHYYFNQGLVVVKYHSPTQITITGQLNNGYKEQRQLTLSQPVQPLEAPNQVEEDSS